MKLSVKEKATNRQIAGILQKNVTRVDDGEGGTYDRLDHDNAIKELFALLHSSL